MGRIAVAIIAAAFASIASSSRAQEIQAAAGPAATTIEAAVRAAHVEMRRAAEKLDASALFEHVLDTTGTPPIIENGRVAQTRAAALERTATGLGQLSALAYTYEHDNITVISPTVALWVADGTALATLKDGRRLEAPFAETVLFVQKDGQWKVLHAHRSSPNPR